MKFGSVCSGIEAASVAWESLGFEAQWFSEIEHFPSEVLKYRYPTVPNLGDMTKLFSNKTFLDSHIDLLVGGTPCQSFSVAGLRKGMEDPRGNLTLTFLSLIDIKKPKWIVWENVPGIISSNQGKDFQSFLDGLEEIGYICDVEILDAQYFGVAQRRRRVFVCGQSVDSILKERTITSALTIAQCLTEILHSILIEVLSLYEREPIKSDQASLSRDGVMRRMKLFGILTENCNYKNWQELLVEVFLKHHPVQKNWDLPLGEKSQKELTLEDLLMGLNQEGQSTLTEESLRKALEDLYEVMKLYTTLTLTRETIQSKISIFFQAGESISRLIARLSDSSPNSLSATLSSLTLLQELTNYARQTNSDIFSEMAGIYEVGDFLKQAQHRNAVIGYLGDWRVAAAVLFERESLQRDIKSSRKKRQEVTADAQGGVGATSPDGRETIGTLRARDYKGVGNDDLESGRGLAIEVKQVAHPVHAFKVRGGCEGGGKGYLGQEEQAFTISAAQDQQIAQPIAYSFDALSSNSMKSSNPHSGCREVDVAKTLDTTTPEPSKNQGGIAIAQPIAVDTYNQTINEHTSQTIRSDSKADQIGAVLQPIAVDTYNQTVNERTSQTIGSSASDVNHYGAVLQPTIIDRAAFNQGQNAQYEPRIEEGQTMSSLVAKGPHAVQHTMAIRRLTPFETEILQGFPRGWTKIPYRNKPADQCPDGPRYKACGNSMAVPVMRWIGQRIQLIDTILNG